jgi:hypothetical protein
MDPQLDLFSTRTYQNEMYGAEYKTFRVNAPLTSGPIEFHIDHTKEYYDLSQTLFSLKVQVMNQEGEVIPTSGDGKDNAALVNNAMHSVFGDVMLSINGKPTEGVADGWYAYKSYISSLFKYSKDVQTQQLFAEGFLRDSHATMNTITNPAFVSRKGWTAAGAIKEFYGKLNCGMFQQDRLLIPGVEFHLQLERNKDTIAIFTPLPNFKPKVVIKDVKLHLLAVNVNPAIRQHHELQLARGLPAIYDFNKVEIDTIIVNQNTTNDWKDNLFHGRVPKFMVMGMLSSTAFHGDYAQNPFNFKHFNIKSLLLTRDDETVPYERFEPDFRTGNCLKEFMSLYQSNDLLGKNRVLPINFEEFKNGYTFFQWNLSDNMKGVNSAPYQRANLKLDFAFDGATAEPMVMVLYGIFESTVQVFGNDQVFVDGN